MLDFLNFLPYNLKWFVLISFCYPIIKLICNGPKTNANRNIKDKIVIVTGSSAGIGKETAIDLLSKGAKVIFACRDKIKTENVINKITEESNKKNAYYMNLNLASFKSVGNFVEEFSKKFEKVDIIINNAGVFNDKLMFTEDDIENTIQTNHISHVFLTGLLLKYLKKSDDPRVINVGSDAHKFISESVDYFKFDNKNFTIFSMYSLSKSMNNYFTESLAKFSKQSFSFRNLLSSCCHPGAVNTEITRFNERGIFHKLFLFFIMYPIFYLTFKDEKMGAQTTLHCCYISNKEFSNGG
jgi:NAD(P)-dependent dehydrogenase (short-subunit alcohol dehydrogenase family)